MKIFMKEKYPNGKRKIYFLGKKFFSYKKRQQSSIYDKIYSKRFNGISAKEARYILEYQFERMVGYKLNLDNPKSFNEKIQSLKLYYHDPLMTKCADKVAVRDYVKEKIGEKYLVPCLGIYKNPDEIDFSKLPNKFALKVNWGSGQNIICKDKAQLNQNEVKEKLRNWMRPENNHYYNFLEWVYKDIEPKIIAEEFIESSDDLVDYKFMCYNGEPKNMFLVQNRDRGHDEMRINFFDNNFKLLPITRLYKRSEEKIMKPKQWDEMIKLSKILAEPFPFVRVDWYIEKDGNLKLGELTFSPGNGTEPFSPIEWDYKFGSELDLPQKRL